jgi:hypothetical protein
MGFYEFPVKHWQNIRTSNPIESTFGTAHHRTTRFKGYLFQDTMLHMMFKLGQRGSKKRRRLRGFDYLAKVVTGIKFKDGVELTQVNQIAACFIVPNTTFDKYFWFSSPIIRIATKQPTG